MIVTLNNEEVSGVVIKPRWALWLPWIGGTTANALYPFIFIPPAYYESLESESPSALYEAVILHEREHLVRQRQTGVVWWMMKYFFLSQFRYEEEIVASRPQMIHLKKHGLVFDTEKKARQLSGLLYLYCVGYHEAKERLDKLWEAV